MGLLSVQVFPNEKEMVQKIIIGLQFEEEAGSHPLSGLSCGVMQCPQRFARRYPCSGPQVDPTASLISSKVGSARILGVHTDLLHLS